MAQIDSGSSSSGKANVDSNYNLNVNLPTTGTQAGFSQINHVPTSTVSKNVKVNEDGQLYSSEARQVFHLDFNAVSTAWSGKIGTNATSMTKVVQTNGFMRLNAGGSTTTTQGISIYSNRVIAIENGYDYRIRFQVRHVNANATNKVAEIGLGYYAFAAGQAAAMNEFIGFRWNASGVYQAVLETSEGGAAGAQTTNLNSGTPLSDNVSREYEIVLTELYVEFWVDGVYQTRIAKPTTMYGTIKGVSLPVIARVFNNGAASAACTIDIAQISVIKNGADDGQSHQARMAAMDKSSYYAQPDIIAAGSATHNLPASATAPTTAVGSNTASVLNTTAQMGGFYQMTGTTVTATVQSNFLIASYQNPAIPTTAGVATNSRNFYVTSIHISPTVVNVVLVGGGYVANWFAAIGLTATSMATTDADGTTAVAQKAPRLVPLTTTDAMGAAAAVGTVATRTGDSTTTFATPLVIHPGEFLNIGIRTMQVTAAVTSGNMVGSIGVNGYWD